MMRILQEFPRNHLQQAILHRAHVLARRQSGAVGDAEDMGVHRHGRFAEGGVEHHVGGLAADPGQGFQCCAVGGHFAAVLLDQDRAGGDHVPGLGIEQADGGDVGLQPVLAQGEDGLRGIGHREQLAGRLVHADVGGLRRQRHRHQQFERRAVLQLGGRVRIQFAQAGEHLAHFRAVHAPGAGRARDRAGCRCRAWVPGLRRGLRIGPGRGPRLGPDAGCRRLRRLRHGCLAFAWARARMAAAAGGRAGLRSGAGGGARRASRSAARRARRTARAR